MMKCFALPFAQRSISETNESWLRDSIYLTKQIEILLVCSLEMRHDKLLDGLVTRKYKGKFQCLIVDRDEWTRHSRSNRTTDEVQEKESIVSAVEHWLIVYQHANYSWQSVWSRTDELQLDHRERKCFEIKTPSPLVCSLLEKNRKKEKSRYTIKNDPQLE